MDLVQCRGRVPGSPDSAPACEALNAEVLQRDLVHTAEQLVEEAVADRAPSGDVEPIDHELAFALIAHQPGIAQDPQVVARVALLQLEMFAELAHARWS